MKRKTTTVTEEYDDKGNLTSKTTETTEEEDNGYIYPQSYQQYPNAGTSNTYVTEFSCDNSVD